VVAGNVTAGAGERRKRQAGGRQATHHAARPRTYSRQNAGAEERQAGSKAKRQNGGRHPADPGRRQSKVRGTQSNEAGTQGRKSAQQFRYVVPQQNAAGRQAGSSTHLRRGRQAA